MNQRTKQPADPVNSLQSILMAHFPKQESQFKRYLNEGVTLKLFAGELITKNCERDHDFLLYYISSGKCKVGFERSDGSFFTLDTRGADCMILSEYSSVASFSKDQLRIIAVENSILVAFTKSQCYDLVCRDPRFFEEFLYFTNVFYSELTHRLLNTAHLSADQKLLTWLDKLCQAGTPDEDGVYSVHCELTQSEIADLLLIHLTTCNKLLSQLTKERIIRKTKDQLFIYRLDFIRHYLDTGAKVLTE